jgi:hypothetical protein
VERPVAVDGQSAIDPFIKGARAVVTALCPWINVIEQPYSRLCNSSNSETTSMAEGSWYNGYSTKERDKKFKELKKRIARGETSPATGPCALCGDPDVPVEYHDEDYGEPFIWEAPALLALCRHCHRDKLHKRFCRHAAWRAFVAHIRRGGYARDLQDDAIKRELARYKRAHESGEACTLDHFGHFRAISGRSGSPTCASIREVSLTQRHGRDLEARCPRSLAALHTG